MKGFLKIVPVFVFIFYGSAIHALAGEIKFYEHDRVVTPEGLEATVTQISTEDRMISVKVPGYPDLIQYSPQELVSMDSSACQNHLCPGDSVTTEHG